MEPIYNIGPQAEFGVGLFLIMLALGLIGLGIMIWL
jgi:hypothetical protein